MSTRDDDSGFLERWARRKAHSRQGRVDEPNALPTAAEPVVPDSAPIAPRASAPAVEPAHAPASAPASAMPPPPTLDDVAALPEDASDFSRFVAPQVAPEVQRAALKKLFSDPHFNVMDGLDTYIDDYGKPDPIPAAWLRQLTQGRFAGLFQDETEAVAVPTPPTGTSPMPAAAADTSDLQSASAAPDAALTAEPLALPDEDPDLRLQPQPAAGPQGLEAGAVAPRHGAA